MKITPRSVQSLVVVLTSAILIAATPATKPSTPVHTSTPTSKPVMGPDTSIAKDQYHFPAPPTPEWGTASTDPNAESMVFTNQSREGQISIELLPKDATTTENGAVAVIKKLKQIHAQNHDVVVLQPKIEKDKRFAFVIHEQYKVGDVMLDRLHIYKSVGPRALLVTANSLAKDIDKTAEVDKAAEEMLDEATFNRKAFKKE